MQICNSYKWPLLTEFKVLVLKIEIDFGMFSKVFKIIVMLCIPKTSINTHFSRFFQFWIQIFLNYSNLNVFFVIFILNRSWPDLYK